MMAAAAAKQFTGRLRPELLESLVRVSDYLHANTSDGGDLICPDHRIDHTGRSARSIVIDCALHAATGDAEYLTRAESRALTVAERLVRDPDHGGWIYHPGRLEPANNSNNVIDGGECTDALATFLMQFDSEISPAVRERIANCLAKNCDSYLVEAVVSKEVTNQRLWGASGLAAAFRLTANPKWKYAVVESVRRSMDEQNPDGSFPYHSRPEDFGIHAGAGGVSVYYQSRVLAFAAYALMMCGELDQFRRPLDAGLDFLRCVTTPLGYKPLALESKRWFWESSVEAGSHPYDIYTLALLGDGDGTAGEIAVKCARLLETQDDDGAFRGVPDGDPGFLCRHFHTADIAWLARASEYADVQPDYAGGALLGGEPIRTFPQAGLIRFESSDVCALIAARPEPRNLLWGASAGYGDVVYLGRCGRGWVNEVSERAGSESAWEAPASAGPTDGVRAFLKSNQNQRDLRFRAHVARNAWRSGRRMRALMAVVRDLANALAGALGSRYRSRNWRDWNVEVSDGRAVIGTGFALEDGSPLPDVVLRRELEIRGDRLAVTEVVRIDAPIGGLSYISPSDIDSLDVDSSWEWSLRGGRINFLPGDLPGEITITYRR